jgi:hypothetical protein
MGQNAVIWGAVWVKDTFVFNQIHELQGWGLGWKYLYCVLFLQDWLRLREESSLQVQNINVSKWKSLRLLRSVLPKTETASHKWLLSLSDYFKWIEIRFDEKFNSLVTIDAFQFLDNCTWLEAMDKTTIKHLQLHSKL